jgi:hypothetical protein
LSGADAARRDRAVDDVNHDARLSRGAAELAIPVLLDAAEALRRVGDPAAIPYTLMSTGSCEAGRPGR